MGGTSAKVTLGKWEQTRAKRKNILCGENPRQKPEECASSRAAELYWVPWPVWKWSYDFSPRSWIWWIMFLNFLMQSLSASLMFLSPPPWLFCIFDLCWDSSLKFFECFSFLYLASSYFECCHTYLFSKNCYISPVTLSNSGHFMEWKLSRNVLVSFLPKYSVNFLCFWGCLVHPSFHLYLKRNNWSWCCFESLMTITYRFFFLYYR